MQISIIPGIYSDENADFRKQYPRNLIPVAFDSGISQAYLRPADGIVGFGTTGPGCDRGGINWNGVCYRVMGSKLVSVSDTGTVTIIGDVGGTDSHVKMDYSFDHLAVVSDGNLFLYDGSTFAQNVDPDLGTVIDVIYVDGYFMLTDSEFLIVTDIGNPFSVNPLKYGSSEVDPDPIKGLLKVRNEPYAINRHTIEVFQNIGGAATQFPFQRVEGTRIDRGAIGTFSKCWFLGTVAFLGGARNESPGIWLGLNADSNKISTREIDQILQEYTEDELSDVTLEPRVDKAYRHLMIRLPDQTIVYDHSASQSAQKPIWHTLTTSIVGNDRYMANNLTWVYDQWVVGDCYGNLGYLDDSVSSHWGQTNGWEFSTQIIYNESRGAIIHEMELVGLPGRVALGDDPVVWASYSTDGEIWSQEKSISAGKQGKRNKRLVWFQNGHMDNYRIQKFRGTSDSHLSIARLEAQLEGLKY
ncbi:MAG: packaged DNA stabilization protein gp10 [Desulfatitalea sp.]|nr:packaged DNA stabilization protein gp10 [Desulfatitalea sp.]